MESQTFPISNFYNPHYDQYEQALKFIESRLDDPGVAQAWAAGQSMTLDQAVVFAPSYSL